MEDNEDLSTEEIENPELTMDETIQQTLDEINSREVARDDSGRFKKPEPEPETPPEVSETVELVIEQPATVPPELQRLGIRKEEALEIAKNPAAMNAIIRRSEEMHRGLETYREKATFGETIQNALAPYMANIQQSGMTPAVAIKSLFTAEQMLRSGSPQQKIAMLQRLANDSGIDLQQAAQAPAQSFDPVTYQLQSKLSEVDQWIAGQKQALEWQTQQSLNSEIERFKSQPDKVHFEDVRDDMAGLLQAGLATDLNDAYEKAIYANPTVRAKVLAQQQEQAEAQRKAIAAQKAQAAKQASSVNVTRKGTMAAAKPVGSMEDTIRETARELGIL